jgi:hypothetical protein
MNALFVSPEHQRRTLYRTHKAYRAIFFLLLGWCAVLVTMGVVLSNIKAAGFFLSQRLLEAEREEKVVQSEEEKLTPSIQKIQRARAWSESLTDRVWLADVLFRIERAIPATLCLTRVSVQNHFANLKAPDRLEIELDGVAKPPGAAGWQTALQSAFPGWRVLSVRSGAEPVAEKNADASEDREPLMPFSFVIQQPVPLKKEK